MPLNSSRSILKKRADLTPIACSYYNPASKAMITRSYEAFKLVAHPASSDEAIDVGRHDTGPSFSVYI